MVNTKRNNRVFTATFIIVAVFLLCVMMSSSVSIAKAEEPHEFYISSDSREEMGAGEVVSCKAHIVNNSLAGMTPYWTCTVNSIEYCTGYGMEFSIEVPRVAGDYVVSCVLVDGRGKADNNTKCSLQFRVNEWGRDWEDIYDDFTEDLRDDWYFDEQYLDLYNAIEEMNRIIYSSDFDKEALKNDPIVIASIETGIGVAYDATGEFGGKRCGIKQLYINGVEVEYRLHPIFEDLLLTDENGNYVYYVSTDTFLYEYENGSKTTFNWPKTGDIAADMVSFDDHGVGVTGIMAYLIHMFGLEDYIKIMPIKSDDCFVREDGVLKLKYTPQSLNRAIQWAYDHGADIVNASFGMPEGSLYETLADKILVVGASGNNNKYETRPPAGSDKVLGVMNYVKDENGNLIIHSSSTNADYGSTYGEWFDIAAPGENLVIPAYGLYKDYCASYKIMGGTSSSAPVATFATALAMLRYRGLNNYGSDIELTPQVIKEMIPHSSDQVVTRVKDNGEVFECLALDLKNLITYDFYGDKAFLEKIGVDVDNALNISSTAQEINIVGDVLTFNGTTSPSELFANNNLYWWYTVGGKTYEIGYGWSINLELPNETGEYAVYCAVLDENDNTIIECVNPATFNVYLKPEALNLEAEMETDFKVDTTEKAYIRAFINQNEYTDDIPYWWLVGDNNYYLVLGSGWEIEFDIPNLVGNYTVFCGLKDAKGNVYAQCEEGVEFAVTYYTVEEVEFIAPEKIEIGDVPSFKVSNILDPEIADGIEWYVNDRLASTGAEFSIVVLEAGTYKVTAKVDGQLYEIGTYTIEREEEPPVHEDENPEVLPPADKDNNGTESDPKVTEDTDKTLVAIIMALSAVSVAGVVTSCAMGAKLRGKSKKNR